MHLSDKRPIDRLIIYDSHETTNILILIPKISRSKMLFLCPLLAMLVAVTVASSVQPVSTATPTHLQGDAVSSTSNSNQIIENRQQNKRKTYMLEDPLFPDDVCLNSYGGSDEKTPIYGACDTSRFPSCGDGGEDGSTICYNRRPRRDAFHPDIVQPKYYIDYRSVLCYPQNFNGCSSCSPGRYCESESRCILDYNNYPCSQWI